MKAIQLKLPNSAKFHLGEYTEDQTTTLSSTSTLIHSDVLFGAFMATLDQVEPDKINVFRKYFEEGNIAFSSAFYVVNIGKKSVYLLPKPVSLHLFQPKNINNFNVKKFKKIEFISKGVWEKGISPEAWLDETSECVMPNSRCVCLKSEIGDQKFELYQIHKEEKVKINNNEDNEPFFINYLSILGNEKAKVDFYFLVKEENLPTKDRNLFYKIWDIVALNGIGGERSTGCGSIIGVSQENFEIEVTEASEKKILLGLAFPKYLEKYHYYQTKVRGGMNYGENKSIKLLTAIQEGAVAAEKEPSQIIDLSQDHKKYWKYSSSLVLDFHKNYDL